MPGNFGKGGHLLTEMSYILPGIRTVLRKIALIFFEMGVIFFGNEAISEWGDWAVNACGIMI